MIKTLWGIVKWVARDFGPLLVFYGTNHWAGFVPALVASMVWAVGDVALVKWLGQKVTPFLKFSIVVTVGFGLVDLYLKGPWLFRYEAALSNVVTAAFFGMTLRGTPLIQEFALRRGQAVGRPVPVNPETQRYFRLSTGVWTGYFILKACIYAYLGSQYDLEKALAIRIVLGNASFYTLLGTNIFLAGPIIRLLRRYRPLPPAEPPPQPAVDTAPPV